WDRGAPIGCLENDTIDHVAAPRGRADEVERAARDAAAAGLFAWMAAVDERDTRAPPREVPRGDRAGRSGPRYADVEALHGPSSLLRPNVPRKRPTEYVLNTGGSPWLNLANGAISVEFRLAPLLQLR